MNTPWYEWAKLSLLEECKAALPNVDWTQVDEYCCESECDEIIVSAHRPKKGGPATVVVYSGRMKIGATMICHGGFSMFYEKSMSYYPEIKAILDFKRAICT